MGYIESAYNELKRFAKTDEQKALLKDELEQYRTGLISKYTAVLHADSRTMSAMITGPSKFPTKSNQKKLDTAMKRGNELLEWDTKARRAIKSKLVGPQVISSDMPDAIEQLQKKIDKAEERQATMKAANKIVKSKKLSEAEKISKLQTEVGFSEKISKELFKPDDFGNRGFAGFELTNNNANIKRMKGRIKELESKRADTTKEVEFEGGKVVDNVEDNRLQIFFDDKPDVETRSKLKGAGFRWAPSVGAWQRNRGANANYALSRAIGVDIAKAEPTEQPSSSKSRIKAKLKDQRGSISFQKLKADSPALYDDLMAVSQDILAQGHTKFSEFRAEMRKTFSDVWEKIRRFIYRLWQDAKRVLKSEEGAITFKKGEPKEAIPTEEKPALISKYLPPEKRPAPPTIPGGPKPPSFQDTLEPVTDADYVENRKDTRNLVGSAITSLKRIKAEIVEGVDKFMGAISTRLGQVSAKLKAKLRRLDFDINTKYAADVKKVEPLLRKAKGMTRDDFADWDYARKNSDIPKLNELIAKYDMQKEWDAYRKTLDEIRAEGVDVGLRIGEIEEYSPRSLKDSRGFLTAIGKEDEWPIYSRRIEARAQELGIDLTTMAPERRADIISDMILGGWTGLGGISATKPRQLQKIPANLNKYYMNSDSALIKHLYEMRKTIEARKFFGKIPQKVVKIRKALYIAQAKIRELNKKLGTDLPEKESETTRKLRNKYIGTERQLIAYLNNYAEQRDYRENIGSYIDELIIKKEISPRHERVVNEILNARFHEAGTRGLVRAYKNFSLIDTMGSVISALTQIGDLAWPAYEGGFVRTFKFGFKALMKKSRITKEDVGVTHIAQEFADPGTLGKAVSLVFKVVGLEKIDTIGKEALLNIALDKFQKRAKTEPNKLKREIRPIFELETDSVIEDLVNGEISENVKLLVYSRLLDFQPLALSEMPQKYLDAGNGRLFYMLKTFTLKVFDVYRNEVYNKVKKGDRAEKIQGLKNLVRLSMIFVLANAGADELKDWVLGRKTDFEDRVVDNILRLFGVSKFVTWKARTEGVGSAIARQILPPFKFVDSLGKDIITAGDEKGLEVLGSVPVIGKLAYWHIGRGTSKREDLWDRRLRKRKAKLNKINDRFKTSKNKAQFRQAHREELAELRRLNRFQGRLNKYRFSK